MSETVNPWAEQRHSIRVYNHVSKEWEDVDVTELSEEDWRLWVCHQLKEARE